MTLIQIIDGLPYVPATLVINGITLQFEKMLLDTGSAGTLFDTDTLENVGVYIELTDYLARIIGIGGEESVAEKQADRVQVGDLIAAPFTIEVGKLYKRYALEGIIGLDFLLQTGAIIDFKALEIRRG